MNIVWVFEASERGRIDAGRLARGTCEAKPMCRIDAVTADRKPRGHIGFPKLPDKQLERMLPLRPVALGIEPARPQPVDPLHLEIQGDLRNRIRRVLDRWGYSARDQKFVAGFLADAGFDTAARALEGLCLLSRLMKVDLDLEVPFEALIARQAREGELAGAFPGGAGIPRLACSWEQGILLQAMLAYYEHSGGDPRALEAAARIAEWEDRMVSGKISVGSWGGNGRFGALEGLVTYAWRAKDAKALDVAKRIAEINRGTGGIKWMFTGDGPQEHLHSCLTTVRGFPWLYAKTGDRTYLDDAIAACDRVFDQCTWGNGCVSEWTTPEASHCFGTDETCCTADETMLSLELADLTGEGRFFDRADFLYYNALRFHQWYDGNFNGYSDPYVGVKGPQMWYCCTWWGTKALYETARHLYASSATEVFVNGFMPSRAELPVKGGSVTLATKAKIPESGDVRIVVTPKGTRTFALNVRVPGWAVLRSIEVNGAKQSARLTGGYVPLLREWRAGDRVDVHFDMPLRVALDDGQGPNPIAEGKVSVEGASPAGTRSIVICRGPVILAQSRLQGGCDLIWAYSGDDPYLFETTASAPDEFTLGGTTYRPTGTPEIVSVGRTASGVRLEWSWRTGPAGEWDLRRSAVVAPTLPVDVEYSAELIPPPSATAAQIDEAVKSGRFCGTRMQYGVSDNDTYFDKPAHPVAPRLAVGRGTATLDSGSVQFRVRGAGLVAGGTGVYGALAKKSGRLTAKCRLTVTGRSQFD
jgi:hypothetical protein